MELVYLKAKVHELEGRLELETSTKTRLQSTVERLKNQLEQVTSERDKLLTTVQTERQNSRQLSRSLREAREDKERAERRLADEEQRRCETSTEVSSCVQEQLRLQQELSQLLLRCKEEELRSVVMRRKRQEGGGGSLDELDETSSTDDDGEAIVESTKDFVNRLSRTVAGDTNGKSQEEAPTNGGDRGRKWNGDVEYL